MTSAMKMAALAAAVLLILAGSAIHDHLDAARTASPAVPKMPPRQSVEMVAPAATITSTVHYQAGAPSSSCTATTCTLPFPKPGSKRQVNITRMNCVFFASAGSTFSHGEIQFYDAAGIFTLREILPVDSSSSTGVHSINSAVDLQITGAQHIEVLLALASGTQTAPGCTASGTLSTLG